jgi:putative sterol carrier protein
MAMRLFSHEWTEAWRQAINTRSRFQERARDWQGTLVLLMAEGDHGPDRAVFLDLHDGTCREARPAELRDRRRADFVIRARERTWRDLFSGRADLVLSILLGRFALERGSLEELRPHVAAARELLRAAGDIDSA